MGFLSTRNTEISRHTRIRVCLDVRMMNRVSLRFVLLVIAVSALFLCLFLQHKSSSRLTAPDFETDFVTPQLFNKRCCDVSSGVSLSKLCRPQEAGWSRSPFSALAANCTCRDFVYCRLVVVTALSSNHLDEAQDMVASIQTFLPQTKIIVYDLGLTTKERSEFSKLCNVEVRQFAFERYPTHVSSLRKFAWKPLIVQEVASQHEVILYGDASLRMIGPDIHSAFDRLAVLPFLSGSPHHYIIISMTHEGMIEYLNYPPSREEMSTVHGVEANSFLLWVNNVTRSKLLNPWVDCALSGEDCISPPDTKPDGCSYFWFYVHWWSWDGRYINCHRFDQSALNIILEREFGPGVWSQAINTSVSSSLWRINRHQTQTYRVVKCTR